MAPAAAISPIAAYRITITTNPRMWYPWSIGFPPFRQLILNQERKIDRLRRSPRFTDSFHVEAVAMQYQPYGPNLPRQYFFIDGITTTEQMVRDILQRFQPLA